MAKREILDTIHPNFVHFRLLGSLEDEAWIVKKTCAHGEKNEKKSRSSKNRRVIYAIMVECSVRIDDK